MNTGIDETLKAIHAPAIVRHIVVRYGLPLTPHLIQAARGIHAGHYELNVWDWLYDFDAKQPLDVSASELRLRVVLAAPLFCFARP